MDTEHIVQDGDQILLFRLLQGVEMLRIADKTFDSHLFTGTGKFASSQLMVEAIRASGHRAGDTGDETCRLAPAQRRYPRTAYRGGCDPAQIHPGRKRRRAIFAAHLAHEALGTNWLKLEIHPDARWLLPDPIETLKAAETLVQQGFVVLPYCGADPVLCKRLEEVGCAAVMPLGAPIGSNQGLETRAMLKMLSSRPRLPVVVDARIAQFQPCRAGAGNGVRRGVSEYGDCRRGRSVNMAKAFSFWQ